MKKYLTDKVTEALASLGYLEGAVLTFEKPKIQAHGDMTTNIAMTLAKSLKKNPRAVALEIISALKLDPEYVSKTEVAGPGFINFSFTDRFFTAQLGSLLQQGAGFGKSSVGDSKKVQVEFVSANPTGPLSVGHGRQAAIGDTIANLLEWVGYQVTREYYYNNAGRQMRLLAESTFARYQQLFEPNYPFPEDGYQGDYIREIAESLKAQKGDSLRAQEKEKALDVCKSFAEQYLFEEIKKVLARMGVRFDVFYNEDSLYSSGKITEVIQELRSKGLAYDQDGAVWFKTTEFGSDKDRVIVKSSGEPTYRLPDIVYHREKFKRGFDIIVDVFGADHIATFPDVLAGVKALGYDPEKVKVVIHQFVTLLKDDQQVKMSKRAANFVTLDELLDDAGSDAVRFFFLMRSISSHLEFDVNLAKEQSENNPVYYLQYAHARIASIVRFAESEGALQNIQKFDAVRFDLLKEPAEVDLIKLLLEFPETVLRTCLSFEPHHVPTYLRDVATAFHRFYHEHRVVIEDKALSQARLALCLATKTVLANGFAILGITAPDRM